MSPTVGAISFTLNSGDLMACFKGVFCEWMAVSPKDLSGWFRKVS